MIVIQPARKLRSRSGTLESFMDSDSSQRPDEEGTLIYPHYTLEKLTLSKDKPYAQAYRANM